jgi:diguanylate cyclase (GGDEF)-like protein
MQRLTQAVDAAISSGTPYEIELHTIRKDGAVRVCLARGFAEMSPEKRVIRLFGSLQDITERKLAEEKVQLLNVELGKLVVTDTLTQINNRRYFMQRGTEEILRENRSNQPLVLLMMDLDEFKKVNDSHGHAVGDLVLQHVARVLSSNVREIDILGRLGGEEFAVLSPNTSLKDAVILAERMRQSIENTPIVISGQSLMVTVSIGAAEFREEMTSISALLRNADAAMYQAKHSGRNCVRVFQDLLERPNPR